jgi:hypothetical protein
MQKKTMEQTHSIHKRKNRRQKNRLQTVSKQFAAVGNTGIIMSKRKQYNALEKALEQKYRAKRENEAVLSHEDFKDGKLTVFGYNHLKQQCDYIPYSEDIEIKIPKEYESGFRDTLESMGASELSRIKKVGVILKLRL